MLSRLRPHLTYANVVSSLCLFLVLGGGTAYAAKTIGSRQIANNSVQGTDIKNGSITGKDVKRASLTANLFKKGQLPRGAAGAQGATGAQGPTGPEGPPAAAAFAQVGPTGAVGHARGVVAVANPSPGNYVVTFDRSPDGCVPLATQGYNNVAALNSTIDGRVSVAVGASNTPNSVNVQTSNGNQDSVSSRSFLIALLC